MNYKYNIEWLKSLKRQLGQMQYKDLWHFEQVLDETIANLEPLAKPHGRLIDADAYIDKHEECGWLDDITVDEFNAITPTIIEAEVSE